MTYWLLYVSNQKPIGCPLATKLQTGPTKRLLAKNLNSVVRGNRPFKLFGNHRKILSLASGTYNKSLDASGGRGFRIMTGPTMLEWVRAAASTQTLGAY